MWTKINASRWANWGGELGPSGAIAHVPGQVELPHKGQSAPSQPAMAHGHQCAGFQLSADAANHTFQQGREFRAAQALDPNSYDGGAIGSGEGHFRMEVGVQRDNDHPVRSRVFENHAIIG